jgi:hypothetical protein
VPLHACLPTCTALSTPHPPPQVVLAVAPAPLWAEFHSRFLKGRLMALTSHHAANFVVQAALAGAQGKQQVRALRGHPFAHASWR